MANKRYVFFEAGGLGAYSANLMIDSPNKLFIDINSEALRWWASAGYHTEEEGYYRPEKGDYIVPCDQYCRERYGLETEGSSGDILHMNNKATSFSIGKKYFKSLRVPRYFGGDVVVREVRSAGSAGLSIIRKKDSLVCEYIKGVEYVIDFNTDYGLVFPRATHLLKSGSDTSCTLVGRKNEHFKDFEVLVRDVCRAFNIRGVGNLQVIKAGVKYYFIEVAMRVSGSSFLNLECFGGNVISGYHGNQDFYSRNCTTRPRIK